ncbi:hypothetical protein HYC85_009732 [Camellia sinensis]|uniref:acireductone dioxygenase (Fe(2+)-requiring) n=1 Tax=Camellia sinensis TaxID=4442 RepID=A0A7J7HIG8_CAMSI|nr:hypothetical protein HYC85_009732 [Camellia sinensis]
MGLISQAVIDCGWHVNFSIYVDCSPTAAPISRISVAPIFNAFRCFQFGANLSLGLLCGFSEKLPNYEEKIKNFFEEHLHIDEKIRYCVAGNGYFDVRDRNDAWICLGGIIILPARIYGRFTLDSNYYLKAMWFFICDPIWTPVDRPRDHLPARKEYVKNFVQKESANQAVNAAAA